MDAEKKKKKKKKTEKKDTMMRKRKDKKRSADSCSDSDSSSSSSSSPPSSSPSLPPPALLWSTSCSSVLTSRSDSLLAASRLAPPFEHNHAALHPKLPTRKRSNWGAAAADKDKGWDEGGEGGFVIDREGERELLGGIEEQILKNP